MRLLAGLDMEMVNHGSLGQVASFDEAGDVVSAIVEMAQVVDSVVEKVHRHSDHVVLVTLAGSVRMEGGERWGTHQLVVACVRDNRIALVEMWDREDLDAALARYEELVEELTVSDETSAGPVNQASEMGQRLAELLRAGDFEGYRACYHPDARIVSHLFTRHLTDSEDSDRDAYVANVISRSETGLDFGEHEMRTLAVRGEHLVLNEFVAPSGDGWETSMFAVRELGDEGRIVFTSYYEPDDLAAAYAELEERFLAGEGAPYREVLKRVIDFRDAMNRGDLESQIALVPEGFVLVDHGPLGWGTLDREQQIDRLRSGHELTATAVTYHPVYHRLAPGVALCEVVVLRTSHDGSHSERRYLLLSDVRPGGIREQYDLDQLDEAIARFDELTAVDGPIGRPVNRASEMGQRLAGLLRAGDTEGYRAGHHPEARMVSHLSDRRVNDGLEFAEHEIRTLAVRGERLVLDEFSAPSGDGWETSNVVVRELGDDGRIVFTAYYEPDALVDAHLELDRRFIDGEGATFRRVLEAVTRFNGSVARNDLDGWLGVMSETIVGVDHKALGWGALESEEMRERIRSRHEMAEADRSVIRRYLRLAPSVAMYEYGVAFTYLSTPSPDAGWETQKEFIAVATIDPSGRIDRFEEFALDQLDEAIVRFEELTAADDSPTGPINQASGMGQRLAELLRAGDFEGYRACYHPDARIMSHLFTRHFNDSEDADRDSYVANVVSRSETGLDFAEHEIQTLAVRGERLVLDEFVAPSGDRWETSMFAVRELGDDGRIASTAYYEPDALVDAHLELDRRFIEGEGAPCRPVLRAVSLWAESVTRGDFDRWYGAQSEELVAIDHSPLGWGTQDLAATAQRVRSRLEMAETNRLVVRRYPRLAPAAALYECGITSTYEGTLTAPTDWETQKEVIAVVTVDPAGRVDRFEQFEFGQPDEAIARFEELAGIDAVSAGPVNRASEESRRLTQLLRAGDFEGYRAGYHPEARIFSRLFTTRVAGSEETERDTYVDGIVDRSRTDLDLRESEMRTLAVRGERLALNEFAAPVGESWNSVRFALCELGDDGRMIYTGYFEPDQLPEALFELERRYIEGEGAPYRTAMEWVQGHNDAINHGDVDGQLAGYSDRLVAIDHRALGWGTLDKAGFLDRIRSGVEAARLSRVVMPRFHRLTPTAVVVERVIERTSHEGSVGRSEAVWLGLFDESGQMVHIEQYDLDRLDETLARFEELTG